MDLIDAAFDCVRQLCVLYHIDESHAMKHSMDVLRHTAESYEFHVARHPYLVQQQRILFAAAIVHDMCDTKYVDQLIGLRSIYDHLHTFLSPEDFNALALIITTMSYTTVKEKGFPNMNEWQLGYHIVREADLLAAYDLDRFILYGMYRKNLSYGEALVNSDTIFRNRVLRYIEDGLFLTEYGLSTAHDLHGRALLNTLPRTLANI
jgi:hypothetical protein